MKDNLLLGLWRAMVGVPRSIWRANVAGGASKMEHRLQFMTPDHHRLRDLAVVELARENRPLAPEWIAQQLGLPLDRVRQMLDELEKGMTFLFRNPLGEVTWAYPVTVDETPHRVRLSTGEAVFAA